MKINKHIFGMLGTTALLLTTACSNEETFTSPEDNGLVTELYGTGAKRISFTIATEDAVGTRADYNGDLKGGHISDGSKADYLIFAVYESTDYDPQTKEGTWKLAPEFAKAPQASYNSQNIVLGNGQNILKVSSWPTVIQLATDPEKYYRVAFWAQSDQTKAFNTSDLTSVTVNYDKVEVSGTETKWPAGASFKNNDEYRDAFCNRSEVFSGDTKERQEVILRRPFAQINVGTTGADYKNILLGERVYPNRKYQYSQILLKGAANKIDILEDKVSTSDDFKDATIGFAWSPMAAFINESSLPTLLTDLNAGKEGEAPNYNSKDYTSLVPENKYFNTQWASLLASKNEEFLKVHLDNFVSSETSETDFLPYKTEYPTVHSTNDVIDAYYTETFKYLSMCYVLVPAERVIDADANTPTDGNKVAYAKSVLDELHVYFAENADGTDNIYNSTATTAGRSYLNLKMVPVQRNWRTNIIGGLTYMKDPTDKPDPNDPDDPDNPDNPEDPNIPEGPDDPTSVFSTTLVCIHRDPIFQSEYTSVNNKPELDWQVNSKQGFEGQLDDKNPHK